MVKGLSQGTELLHFGKDVDDSEWYVVKLAISGTPCIPFSVGANVVYNYLSSYNGEEQLASYLERQASALIERYGDARSPRPDPVLLEQ